MADQRGSGSSRIAPFVPDEPALLAHCKRVAYYARWISDVFEIPPATRQALEDAAFCHHSRALLFGRGAFDRLLKDLSVPFLLAEDDDAGQVSEFVTIIRATFGHSVLPEEPRNVASEILEACNCLDEAVESAPYEGLSITEVLGRFALTGDLPFCRLLSLVLQHGPVRFDGRVGLRAMNRLPVLPRQIKRLVALSDETATPNDLESIARSDQVLAATLISRANSALYGRSSETKCIRDAIVFLGIPASRNALLSASFQTLYASSSLRQIWKHATEAAEIAERLAVAASGIDPAEAYLAGLVHDIGRLMVERFPQAPRRLESALLENGFPLVYSEAIAYGMDHAELGAELLRYWRFPESLVKAIEYHHRPEVNDSRLSSLLYLTEVICESRGEHAFEDLASGMRLRHAEKRLGLTIERIGEIADKRECSAMAG